jgi:hypothetical protein
MHPNTHEEGAESETLSAGAKEFQQAEEEVFRMLKRKRPSKEAEDD